jgi:hypothetical protein
MSFKHGKSGVMLLGAINLSPYLTGADLSAEVDVADTTTWGATWKTAITGQYGASLAFTGLYDDTNTTLVTALTGAVGQPLTYCPAGAVAGDGARLMDGVEVSYAQSVPVGGVVAVSGAFTATGKVGIGYVLEALTARSGNANGTALDLGTAAAGAVAHLHATAVSADHVQVHIEDSANGSSDWQDVSGWDFTELSAPGSQRAVVTGTVRRYVRAVWTHDGAVTSTFLVSVARTT